MTGASSPDVAAVLGDNISEADRPAVTGAYADWLAQQRREWLAAGVWGWVNEYRALFGDWGFDLREIGASLTIWHGSEDRFVPIGHGEWLVEQTGAKVVLPPGKGHLSLASSSYREMLDGLLGLTSLRP
jgi:pimeloyl-ACP methyl ester carboxylesterase